MKKNKKKYSEYSDLDFSTWDQSQQNPQVSDVPSVAEESSAHSKLPKESENPAYANDKKGKKDKSEKMAMVLKKKKDSFVIITEDKLMESEAEEQPSKHLEVRRVELQETHSQRDIKEFGGGESIKSTSDQSLSSNKSKVPLLKSPLLVPHAADADTRFLKDISKTISVPEVFLKEAPYTYRPTNLQEEQGYHYRPNINENNERNTEGFSYRARIKSENSNVDEYRPQIVEKVEKSYYRPTSLESSERMAYRPVVLRDNLVDRGDYRPSLDNSNEFFYRPTDGVLDESSNEKHLTKRPGIIKKVKESNKLLRKLKKVLRSSTSLQDCLQLKTQLENNSKSDPQIFDSSQAADLDSSTVERKKDESNAIFKNGKPSKKSNSKLFNIFSKSKIERGGSQKEISISKRNDDEETKEAPAVKKKTVSFSSSPRIKYIPRESSVSLNLLEENSTLLTSLKYNPSKSSFQLMSPALPVEASSGRLQGQATGRSHKALDKHDKNKKMTFYEKLMKRLKENQKRHKSNNAIADNNDCQYKLLPSDTSIRSYSKNESPQPGKAPPIDVTKVALFNDLMARPFNVNLNNSLPGLTKGSNENARKFQKESFHVSIDSGKETFLEKPLTKEGIPEYTERMIGKRRRHLHITSSSSFVQSEENSRNDVKRICMNNNNNMGDTEKVILDMCLTEIENIRDNAAPLASNVNSNNCKASEGNTCGTFMHQTPAPKCKTAAGNLEFFNLTAPAENIFTNRFGNSFEDGDVDDVDEVDLLLEDIEVLRKRTQLSFY